MLIIYVSCHGDLFRFCAYCSSLCITLCFCIYYGCNIQRLSVSCCGQGVSIIILLGVKLCGTLLEMAQAVSRACTVMSTPNNPKISLWVYRNKNGQHHMGAVIGPREDVMAASSAQKSGPVKLKNTCCHYCACVVVQI